MKLFENADVDQMNGRYDHPFRFNYIAVQQHCTRVTDLGTFFSPFSGQCEITKLHSVKFRGLPSTNTDSTADSSEIYGNGNNYFF